MQPINEKILSKLIMKESCVKMNETDKLIKFIHECLEKGSGEYKIEININYIDCNKIDEELDKIIIPFNHFMKGFEYIFVID